MLKISRISIILILTAVFLFYLPPQIKKFFYKRTYTPNVSYSSVSKKFLLSSYNENSGFEYSDTDGNKFGRIKYQMLLPMVYFRDLLMWNKLPKEIDKIKIDPRIIERNRQYVFMRTSDFNSPEIKLYPLFESASIYTRIEEPDSLFRIKDSMEFIDAETNKVDKERSEIFTAALKKKDFKFPAENIFGNLDPRKPFDEGYFVVDSAGKVFHLKMKKGKPWVTETGIKTENKIKYMSIEENPRQEFYGVLVTDANEFFLLTYNNYKLVKLPVDEYTKDISSFFMSCDMLKRTIKIASKNKEYCIVTDKNYKIIDTYVSTSKSFDEKGKKYINLLFPLSIKVNSVHTKYIHFDFKYNKSGIYTALAGLIILISFLISRGYKLKDHLADFIIIGAAGLPALAAFFIVGGYKKDDIQC